MQYTFPIRSLDTYPPAESCTAMPQPDDVNHSIALNAFDNLNQSFSATHQLLKSDRMRHPAYFLHTDETTYFPFAPLQFRPSEAVCYDLFGLPALPLQTRSEQELCHLWGCTHLKTNGGVLVLIVDDVINFKFVSPKMFYSDSSWAQVKA